ncbi:Crp/Fnr family transcriptional regulator [Actinocrinis puniceicyclus]|uniref:Crp/Fnr family transcriptional regulator n=1 Tax=Actinocrinis puniceicyclus TaxID=977794 RepID=A0A8J8BAF0_9ACTN|nr:Crp/Fnr family transcriptional regulator [Actinocrinis puniceicyclus]MBS2962003.1 Crp/Fnr family transcriptional regulator [Actinocrinis puniceicyclus]
MTPPTESQPRPSDFAMFDSLRSAGTLRTFESSSYLFRQGESGDSILLIDSGHVKIVADGADGATALLGVRGPGELVGEFAAVTSRSRSASVIALEPVRGYTLDSGSFLRLIGENQTRMLGLIRTVIDKLGESDRWRVEFGSLTVRRRIAKMLVKLADETYRDESGVYVIPLSQKDLAAAVGSSREACAKALYGFRSAQLVATGLRGVRVLDLERLRQIAESPERPATARRGANRPAPRADPE